MTTNQEGLYASLLSLAGDSTLTFNGAVIAANIANGGTATTFNGAWIELLQSANSSSKTNLPELMAEYAAANGFDSWGGVNTFAVGALYAYDFSTETTMPSWMTLTRASKKWDVDLAGGSVTEYAVNEARIDSGAGLYLEEEARNYINNGVFSAWQTTTGYTYTAGQTDPFGGSNAELIEQAATGGTYMRENIPALPLGDYTVGYFANGNPSPDNAANSDLAFVIEENGGVSIIGGSTTTAFDAPDGWNLLFWNFTKTNAAALDAEFRVDYADGEKLYAIYPFCQTQGYTSIILHDGSTTGKTRSADVITVSVTADVDYDVTYTPHGGSETTVDWLTGNSFPTATVAGSTLKSVTKKP